MKRRLNRVFASFLAAALIVGNTNVVVSADGQTPAEPVVVTNWEKNGEEWEFIVYITENGETRSEKKDVKSYYSVAPTCTSEGTKQWTVVLDNGEILKKESTAHD